MTQPACIGMNMIVNSVYIDINSFGEIMQALEK